MQKLLLLITFLCSSIIAKPMCSMSGISTWPATGTVKANPIFILTFYELSRQIVPGLNKQYAVYLRSGNQRVPLIITETCTGQFRLTQVILKPAKKLTPGREYELVIDSLPKYESALKWNSRLNKPEPTKWKVLKEEDNALPDWTVLPKYQSKSIMYFGCGPSVSVVFNYAANETGLLVKTTVQNIRTGKYTTYYLESSDAKTISVGHGMCSGAFDFVDGDEYEASFVLMDGSGNVGCTPSTPIRFTGPTAKDEMR